MNKFLDFMFGKKRLGYCISLLPLFYLFQYLNNSISKLNTGHTTSFNINTLNIFPVFTFIVAITFVCSFFIGVVFMATSSLSPLECYGIVGIVILLSYLLFNILSLL